MNVTNMSWNHSKLIFDSQINNSKCQLQSLFESAIDEKNKHKPIMMSCLAVSRIPTIQTQLQVFHTPHENESNLHLFMDYLIQFQESVKRHLFNEMPLELTPKVDKDY